MPVDARPDEQQPSGSARQQDRGSASAASTPEGGPAAVRFWISEKAYGQTIGAALIVFGLWLCFQDQRFGTLMVTGGILQLMIRRRY